MFGILTSDKILYYSESESGLVPFTEKLRRTSVCNGRTEYGGQDFTLE